VLRLRVSPIQHPPTFCYSAVYRVWVCGGRHRAGNENIDSPIMSIAFWHIIERRLFKPLFFVFANAKLVATVGPVGRRDLRSTRPVQKKTHRTSASEFQIEDGFPHDGDALLRVFKDYDVARASRRRSKLARS